MGWLSLHHQYPEIVLDLIPDPRVLSLSMRVADISVRLKQPDQHDLVVRRIGKIAFGLYASAGYVERSGVPDFAAACPGHHLITQAEDIQDATQTSWLTDLASLATPSMQTTSHEAAVSAAVAGGGLACLARFRADREGGLVRLEIPPPVPQAQIWLVVHRDNRQIPRIRAVLTHITEIVRKMAPQLCPLELVKEEAG